jgi:hypothetical protein
MADQDHLSKLKEGVEAWNKWREENPEVKPDLEAVNLNNADLKDYNLQASNLQQANLTGAYLWGANLQEADLFEAGLRDANLVGADLRQAHLQNAQLQNAGLLGADLRGVKLWRARLEGASFDGSDLKDAQITDVDFSGSNLRNVQNLCLDGNRIEGAKFSSFSKDPWSVLRRGYTGPRALFHLIFLVAFLVPYLAETLWWLGVNRSQGILLDSSVEVQQLALDLEGDLPGQAEAARQLATRLGKVGPCLAADCEERRVWEMLVGRGQGAAWVLVVLLVLYNGVRAWLTYQCGPMREEVEISGFAPYWKDYRALFYGHRVAQVLFVVALATFALNAYIWLFATSVWVPA